MNRIPIVFAFDNKLAMPAAVCFYSLLANALPSTVYDIYILHRRGEALNLDAVRRVMAQFSESTLTLREVGDEFDSSFEIRGITTPAYYRLLIPTLLPEHDHVIYSDVDVIFRSDLTEIYNVDLEGCYFGGVNAIAELDKDMASYYKNLGLDPSKIIYSGNLLFNSKALRDNPAVMKEMMSLAQKKFKFQDMDVINIVCRDKIKYLTPAFCLTNYICQATLNNRSQLKSVWSDEEINDALTHGLVHYNGNKPWHTWAVNFDIWWEYYRRSPIFDERFYFDFFNSKLDELDRLSLLKRIKILARYFSHGKH